MGGPRTLDRTRPGIGAQAVGIAQGALDLAVSYAKQRVQFNRPIADNQGIQFMLADMATKVEASRLLVYNVAELIDRGAEIHPALMKPEEASNLFPSFEALNTVASKIPRLEDKPIGPEAE